jgi:hypothetical protein
MRQSKYHNVYEELNLVIFYQSSSNMSTRINQVISRNFSPYQLLEDNKELQIRKGSSSSKRMNGDELPLVPVALMFWSLPDRNSSVEHHLSEIKKKGSF